MTPINQGAELSECGRYRYKLWRTLNIGQGSVLFVMLNPSTADADKDDPTIRRCLGFVQRWGYRKLYVGNLFALRSTDPRALFAHDDPIGVGNDEALMQLASGATRVVCAWGSHGWYRGVGAMTRHRLRHATLFHLGLCRNGEPKHPLYLRADTTPTPWTLEAIGATQ